MRQLSATLTTLLVFAACADQPFTVDVPLRIVSISPADGGVDVGRDADVVIVFSEAIEPGSANAGTIQLVEVGGGAVAAAISASGNTVTVNPNTTLWYAGTYRVTVSTGIKRERDGGPLPVVVSATFKTLEPLPLQVAYTAPSDGSVLNPIDTPITVVFSEPVDCASVVAGTSFAVGFAATDPVSPGVTVPGGISPTCAAGDDTLTFVPATPLGYSRDVAVTLTTQLAAATVTEVSPLADPTLAHLQTAVTFSFSTIDPPPLLVAAMRPGPNSTGIAADAAIEVTFTEGLDLTPAPAPPNFALYDLTADPGRNNNLCTAVSVATGAVADDTLRCAHGSFVASHQIEARLTGLQSARATVRGGQLSPDPSVYTFEVAHLPPLLILSAIPSDTQVNFPPNELITVRFNQPVNEATLGVIFGAPGQASAAFELRSGPESAPGPVITGTYTKPAADTLRFEPDTDLAFVTTYHYTVTTAVCIVKDPASTGGCVPENFVAQFTTAAQEDLRLVATDPANNATGVGLGGPALGRAITLTFNNPIDTATLSGKSACGGPAGNVFLAKGTPGTDPALVLASLDPADCTGGTPDLDASGRYCLSTDRTQIRFFPVFGSNCAEVPGTDWDFNVDYWIVVQTTLLDIRGAGLSDPALRTFRTQISGLVVRAFLDPTGSILGSFVIDFTEPVEDTLVGGLLPTDGRALFVDFLDRFGNIVPVPASLAFERQDGAACALGNTQADTPPGCDRVRLSPSLNLSNCKSGERALLYSTDYRVHAAVTVRAADGVPADNRNIEPITVSTGPAPEVASAQSRNFDADGNVVTTCELTGGTCNQTMAGEGHRVPVSSELLVTFSQDMLAGSLRATAGAPSASEDTVVLRNDSDGCLVPVTLSQPDARTLVVRPDSALGAGACASGVSDQTGALRFDRQYRLVIRGRSGGNPTPATDPCGPAVTPPNAGNFLEVCTTDGRYLDADVMFTFRTSSANSAFIVTRSLGGIENPNCNDLIPVLFGREVDMATVSTATLVTTENTLPAAGLFAKDAKWPEVVTFVPLPSFCEPEADAIQVEVTTQVRDLLGNPMPAPVVESYTSGGRIGTPAELDTIFPAATVLPGSCDINGNFVPGDPALGALAAYMGHQRYSVCYKDDFRSRFLPSSVNDETLILEDISAGMASAVRETGRIQVIFAQDESQGERAIYAPTSYTRAGRTYRFYPTIRISNRGNFKTDCGTFQTEAPVYFTAEACTPGAACAPTVLSQSPAPFAAEVSPIAEISVTFSEPVDPASIVNPVSGLPTGFFQVLLGPAVVAGTYRFENAGGANNLETFPVCADAGTTTLANPIAFDRVVFVPSQPLATGTYTVSLADAADVTCPDPTATPLPAEPTPVAVTDTAGNCLAATADYTFAVDATAPKVIAFTPAGSAAATASIQMTFSEPMDVSDPGPALSETTYTLSAQAACFDADPRSCLSFANSVTGAGCEASRSCDVAILDPVRPFALFQRTDAAGANLNWVVDVLATQVADLAGNLVNKTPGGVDIDVPAESQFTVVATNPVALCTDPPDGATLAAAGSPLVLTFSEAVARASLADARIEDVTLGAFLVPSGICPTTDDTVYQICPPGGPGTCTGGACNAGGAWPAASRLDITLPAGITDTSLDCTGAPCPLARPSHARVTVP